MKLHWLFLEHDDVKTELRQAKEEGRDTSSAMDLYHQVLSRDSDSQGAQHQIAQFLDLCERLPMRPDYSYEEPSDLEGIRAARPKTGPATSVKLGADEYAEKVGGAWLGRCIGCLLGKPIECWRRPQAWGYMKATHNWPLQRFISYVEGSPEQREQFGVHKANCWADLVSAMPIDDDINYTVSALRIFQKHGPDFSPADVAHFWMGNIPIYHVCTAERVAYRNFVNGYGPPFSATWRNPYREWIGAQIRGDFWGYICPGDPERAAEYAWRDASISHVKNGIYGEMWVAAMVASAFVLRDPLDIILAGAAQIPKNCRLRKEIDLAIVDWKLGMTYEAAVERLHQDWNEDDAHSWCHTLSNARIVCLGLLYGNCDFGDSICKAVQPLFDTDCNGATVGSIVGATKGRTTLPPDWTAPIQNTVLTAVADYNRVTIDRLIEETVALATL